jgi:hypothetical protein
MLSGSGVEGRAAARQKERRMLEMRDQCERCQVALPAAGPARICSFECTFCAECATEMGGVCPNCGGELIARPRRTAAPTTAT